MKQMAVVACVMILIPTIVAQTQAPVTTPAELMLWVGDWEMVGTAKDAPMEPEYKVAWHLHGKLILGGHFVQVDHTRKGKGAEEHWLEIISYDPNKGTDESSGFCSDGGRWVSTMPFKDKACVENGTITTADGKIIKYRLSWVFSDDRMAVSGIQEIEQDGAFWTSFTFKGTKAKTPMKK
jgi:hypothetical protein